MLRASTFVNGVAGSIRRSDIRDDLTPETVGNMVWITVHGCHLLSDAEMDDVFTRTGRKLANGAPPVIDELAVKRHAHLDSSKEQTG